MVAQALASSYLANVSYKSCVRFCVDTVPVCQLHGGDIGVSSIEGEGSTFGFFFKVRRSDGTSDGGRPPFQSRSTSETSQSTNREKTPQQKPSYSRGNSYLAQINEQTNEERPKMETLTSHQGVDVDQVNQSLIDPPTEYHEESHPLVAGDRRFNETQKIAKDIQPERSAVNKAIEEKLPNLNHGETKRQESSAEQTSREQSNQRSDEKQTLLLVEDNLINQKVLRRQLQARGFEVFTADNGQEAIDAVAKRGQTRSDNPNDRNYFDCILMDQEMPVKDGNAATREIRQLQQDGMAGYSHILGVSANVREAQTQSMREAGMDDVISKPFKVEDLVKRISKLATDSNGKLDNRDSGGPPATTTGENEEVRMLEDLPVRRKSLEEKGPKARIEHGDVLVDQGTKEWREEKDRERGKQGEKSGREGNDRGGERSRTRENHNK